VCAATFAQSSDAWRYVPASPDSLTAMNWPKVLNSTFRELLRAEIPVQTRSVMNGLNFIQGINGVVVVRSGPDLLVVLTGNFDLPRLREMAAEDGGTVKQYKGADLLLSSDAESQMALVNEKTILLGSRDAITGAIDRASGKTPAAPPSHDLAINARSPSPEIQQTDIAYDLINGGVRFTADLVTRSPEIAQKIEENARLLDLITTQSGNAVHVTGQLSRDELARRAGQWRITLEQLAYVQPVVKEETPPKPIQGTIRIIGLDDKVREVPLGPQAPGVVTAK
jgi:hypothetical protein